MIATLQLIEKQLFKYPENSQLTEELLSFKRVGKNLEAANGKHDDVILSACFALAVTPFAKP